MEKRWRKDGKNRGMMVIKQRRKDDEKMVKIEDDDGENRGEKI